eukprot:3071006-Rhodomonas_salina.5
MKLYQNENFKLEKEFNPASVCNLYRNAKSLRLLGTVTTVPDWYQPGPSHTKLDAHGIKRRSQASLFLSSSLRKYKTLDTTQSL